jgi:hypothetical protein
MDITRDVEHNVGPDGIDVRLYQRNEAELPSVTSVLKTRDDDKSNLYAWQDENDGNGDNAYHEHLFWYSRQVGTLGHWHALSTLGALDWSVDEAQSLWCLSNIDQIEADEMYQGADDEVGRFAVDGSRNREVHSATPRDVLYSVLKSEHCVETWGEFYDRYPPYRGHDFYTEALLDVVERDIGFFVQAQQSMWRQLGISEVDVVDIEKYLFNDRHGYAGQVDLVYRDGDDFVVADLKSSSGCYDKHQLQAAAYGCAIECSDLPIEKVDRLEVHRAHPRTGQQAVHTSKHTDIYDVHTSKWWDESYETLWDQFYELVEDFEYDTDAS